MYDRQLLTFVRVAETGSLTQAAEKLYITPAAVMKQMNALEARLELRLIERSNQGVRLTRAGEYLYGEALKLIAASDAAVERAREIQSREGRVIRVGSSFLNPGRVLADWWNRMGREPERFGIKIVPCSDDRERILSVVASLGTRLDFMVGVFSSRRMLELADFTELGRYELCVAVPRKHPLSAKSRLEISDLYGERLVMVREGDELSLGSLRETLRREHPQIQLVDTDFYYDMDTFNECELSGLLLLTFYAWRNVHPSLVTLPVNWPFTAPYGLLHARSMSAAAAEFLAEVRAALDRQPTQTSISSM